MKKKLAIIVLAVAMIACGVVMVACDDNEIGIKSFPVSTSTAQQIAMAHTGVDANMVESASVVTETKNNSVFYNVEFTIEGVKYTYRINTNNGDIEKLAINDQPVAVEVAPVAPANPQSNYIGAEAAKTVAFTDAGCLEADVSRLEVEFDFDDGQYLYEIEFVFGANRYEYEIVAASGAIFTKDMNGITLIEPIPSQPGATYIGIEAAKQIALQDAQVQDAQFVKVEFEKDKGAHVYEIEFIVDTIEHEYEINALTGAIIKKEIEGQNQGSTSGEYIGIEAAKTIALSHAGVDASAAIFKEAKLDSEKGVYVYEIEFLSGGYEFEYEINPTTGAILKFDREWND